jgi:hypothetical protein
MRLHHATDRTSHTRSAPARNWSAHKKRRCQFSLHRTQGPERCEARERPAALRRALMLRREQFCRFHLARRHELADQQPTSSNAICVDLFYCVPRAPRRRTSQEIALVFRATQRAHPAAHAVRAFRGRPSARPHRGTCLTSMPGESLELHARLRVVEDRANPARWPRATVSPSHTSIGTSRSACGGDARPRRPVMQGTCNICVNLPSQPPRCPCANVVSARVVRRESLARRRLGTRHLRENEPVVPSLSGTSASVRLIQRSLGRQHLTRLLRLGMLSLVEGRQCSGHLPATSVKASARPRRDSLRDITTPLALLRYYDNTAQHRSPERN